MHNYSLLAAAQISVLLTHAALPALESKAAAGVHTNFCDAIAIEEMRTTSCLHVQKSSARSDQRRACFSSA